MTGGPDWYGWPSCSKSDSKSPHLPACTRPASTHPRTAVKVYGSRRVQPSPIRWPCLTSLSIFPSIAQCRYARLLTRCANNSDGEASLQFFRSFWICCLRSHLPIGLCIGGIGNGCKSTFQKILKLVVGRRSDLGHPRKPLSIRVSLFLSKVLLQFTR